MDHIKDVDPDILDNIIKITPLNVNHPFESNVLMTLIRVRNNLRIKETTWDYVISNTDLTHKNNLNRTALHLAIESKCDFIFFSAESAT